LEWLSSRKVCSKHGSQIVSSMIIAYEEACSSSHHSSYSLSSFLSCIEELENVGVAFRVHEAMEGDVDPIPCPFVPMHVDHAAMTVVFRVVSLPRSAIAEHGGNHHEQPGFSA